MGALRRVALIVLVGALVTGTLAFGTSGAALGEEGSGEEGTPSSEETTPPEDTTVPSVEETAPPEDTLPTEEETTPPEDTLPPEEVDPEPEVAAPDVPTRQSPRPTFVPVKRYNVKRKLVFPIVGVSKFWAGFGACRDGCSREHHGIDIVTYGWKGLPVVAAHDGTVINIIRDEGNPGCGVRIKGRDGWETRYYHLNNDLPGSDVTGFGCPAPGIEIGTPVVAGQIIGYVGDSGNAEGTAPHLHFELRNRSGYPIDPYRSLKAAQRVTVEWLPADNQQASIALSMATHPETARMIIVAPSDEVHRLGMSETSTTILSAPVVAIDRGNPQPAIDEIRRLAPERIVGISDDWASWLRDALTGLAPIVAVAPITEPPQPNPLVPHDAAPTPATELYVPDRFMTIVAGVVDRIHRSRQEPYQAFITHHRTVVLTSDRWAPRKVGIGSWTYPGRQADDGALWWLTGDGWIPTAPTEAAPNPGTAYVTERLAIPYTLNYLGSLAELPPMPVWKSS